MSNFSSPQSNRKAGVIEGVVLEKINPWNNFYLPSGKDSLQTSWFLIVSFPCRRTFYPAQPWFPKY